MTVHEQKQMITAIEEATGRDRKTIRKVVTDATVGRCVRRPRGSKLDAYKQYIEKRWHEGCQNAVVLWEEVRAQGYTGSLSLIKQMVGRCVRSGGRTRATVRNGARGPSAM